MASINVTRVALNSTIPTTTTTITTATTTTTTTISFQDLPGSLLNLHQFCITDWDVVQSSPQVSPGQHDRWNTLNVARVSLCAWVILSHVALLLLVLGKRQLRTQPKNPLVLSLAVAHVLLAVFVVPLKQHFTLNPHIVNCDLDVGWTFIVDYYQSCVSLFAVLSLVGERFIFVYTEKNQKKILRPALIVTVAFLLVAPWLVSLVILLPTYLAGFEAQSALPDTCLYKVHNGFFVAAQVVSFALPSLGVFILAPYTGLLDFLRPRRCIDYETSTPKGETLTVTSIISLISIFCEAPYCVTRVLMISMECDNHYCIRFYHILSIALWVRLVKAALSPFVWLLYTDIRRAVLCFLPKKRSDDDDNDDLDEEVTYQTAMLKELGSDDQTPKKLYPEPQPSTSTAKD